MKSKSRRAAAAAADGSSASAPLAGIRVLDFGHHRAGPHCALLLGRLGAEVIKVEPLGGEQLRSHGLHWAQENNTKKSITVDLRQPAGRQVALDLLAVSDILVQNFRPGVMEKLGLGGEALLEQYPRLIVVNVSAFGARGPQRLRPGFDGIIQALTGLMMVNGAEQQPPMKTHPPIVDRVAGLHAALGAVAALYERERSGRGQQLDVSLLASGYTIPDADLAAAAVNGRSPVRTGNRAGGPPVNNAFEASDGWIYVATGGRENMWQALCRLMGKEAWLAEPRFATKAGRIANSAEVDEGLQQYLRNKTREEALTLLAQAGIPCAPVRTPLEAMRDEYAFERRAFVYVEGLEKPVPVTGDMWHFSRSDVRIGPLPGTGEHTQEVLTTLLGYGRQTVSELRKSGVVG
jgi:CoA:oxalate CoA-transferase